MRAPVDAESRLKPQSSDRVSSTHQPSPRHLLLYRSIALLVLACHNSGLNENQTPKRALIFWCLLAEVMGLSKKRCFHRAEHTVYNASFWSPARKKNKEGFVVLCAGFFPPFFFERCDTNQLDTQIRGDLISPLAQLKQDHHLQGDVLARYYWLACE